MILLPYARVLPSTSPTKGGCTGAGEERVIVAPVSWSERRTGRGGWQAIHTDNGVFVKVVRRQPEAPKRNTRKRPVIL